MEGPKSPYSRSPSNATFANSPQHPLGRPISPIPRARSPLAPRGDVSNINANTYPYRLNNNTSRPSSPSPLSPRSDSFSPISQQTSCLDRSGPKTWKSAPQPPGSPSGSFSSTCTIPHSHPDRALDRRSYSSGLVDWSSEAYHQVHPQSHHQIVRPSSPFNRSETPIPIRQMNSGPYGDAGPSSNAETPRPTLAFPRPRTASAARTFRHHRSPSANMRIDLPPPQSAFDVGAFSTGGSHDSDGHVAPLSSLPRRLSVGSSNMNMDMNMTRSMSHSRERSRSIESAVQLLPPEDDQHADVRRGSSTMPPTPNSTPPSPSSLKRSVPLKSYSGSGSSKPYLKADSRVPAQETSPSSNSRLSPSSRRNSRPPSSRNSPLASPGASPGHSRSSSQPPVVVVPLQRACSSPFPTTYFSPVYATSTATPQIAGVKSPGIDAGSNPGSYFDAIGGSTFGGAGASTGAGWGWLDMSDDDEVEDRQGPPGSGSRNDRHRKGSRRSSRYGGSSANGDDEDDSDCSCAGEEGCPEDLGNGRDGGDRSDGQRNRSKTRCRHSLSMDGRRARKILKGALDRFASQSGACSGKGVGVGVGVGVGSGAKGKGTGAEENGLGVEAGALSSRRGSSAGSATGSIIMLSGRDRQSSVCSDSGSVIEDDANQSSSEPQGQNSHSSSWSAILSIPKNMPSQPATADHSEASDVDVESHASSYVSFAALNCPPPSPPPSPPLEQLEVQPKRKGWVWGSTA